jgi:hypothetical protein
VKDRDRSEANRGRFTGSRLLRLLFAGSRFLPGLVAMILTFVALQPMIFQPADKLLGTLASLFGAGLSLASLSLSAARAQPGLTGWEMRMIAAGLMLFRFAIAMVFALALAAGRARVIADFGSASPLELLFRVPMVLVTAAGIGMAFLGIRELVLLLGPPHAGRPAAPTDPEDAAR